MSSSKNTCKHYVASGRSHPVRPQKCYEELRRDDATSLRHSIQDEDKAELIEGGRVHEARHLFLHQIHDKHGAHHAPVTEGSSTIESGGS